LKIAFPENDYGVVINSCLYDHRTVIENVHAGSEFALSYSCYASDGRALSNSDSGLTFSLGEYSYNNGVYTQDTNNIEFSAFEDSPSAPGYYVSTVSKNNYSKEEFRKKSQVRLRISAPKGTTVYLKQIDLFEVHYLENGFMLTPADQTDDINKRTIEKTYCYFTQDDLENVRNEDQLKPDYITKTLTYNTYKPAYNTGAEKVRSVTAKESNYFNILQNIAETFGMWLMLDIEHSDGTDGLVEGTVK
jgi:hypothetical protein